MTRNRRKGDPSVLKEGPRELSDMSKGQVWDCHLLTAGTSDGKPIEILGVADVQTRECLAILVEHDIGLQQVTDWLFDLLVLKGPPECIRSANAPPPLAGAVSDWLSKTGINTQFAKREKDRQGEHADSFGRRLRDDVIDRRTFADLPEAKKAIEDWRILYNQTRQPEPIDDEAATCRTPEQQSPRGDNPDPTQPSLRQDSVEGESRWSAGTHDPLQVEVETSQYNQPEAPLVEIKTGHLIGSQMPLFAIESRQSVESEAFLGPIDNGQSVESQGSPGGIDTGQSVKGQGDLDAAGTGQSVESWRARDSIETGQCVETQRPLDGIGAGQSVERQGPSDPAEIGPSGQQDSPPEDIKAGQSVPRRAEIETDQSARHRGPLDEIVAGQAVRHLWPPDNKADRVVQRHSPPVGIEASQAVKPQEPLNDIVTGQSAEQQVHVDDAAGARRSSRSKRAIAAVIGLAAPSLKPESSQHRGKPTVREVRRAAVRVTEWVGIAIVALLVAAVALTLIAPYFGWRVDTVRSGDMEPELKVGSVVITRPVDADKIGVGDVITFHSPTSGEMMSRRVSAIEVGPSFRTEAASSEAADPFITPAQGVIGRVCFEVPFAGYIVQRLVTPVGVLLLFIFGFAIVASEIISRFQVRRKEPSEGPG